MDQIPDSTSPAPPGYGHPVLNQFQGAESGTTTTQRRPRPITQHQMALAQSRRERAETLLDQQRRDKYRELRKAREADSFLFRAARRIEELPDDYDTEDEDPRNAWGPGGLVPNSWAEPEDAVYGEEANHWSKVLRRAKKLGERLFGSVSDGKAPEMTKVASSMGTYEGHPAAGAVADPEPDQVEVSAVGDGDADEDLDDIDKELLGEASYEDGVGETGDSGVEGDESEEDAMEED
jgi:Ino eighty subunit 1